MISQIALGNTGLRVSRLCIGTGTNGWAGRSNQTRLGFDRLVDLLCCAYDRGITFWDLADGVPA
jgi:1-deoxyxylulose-5-phosphate synthase